MPRDIQTVYLAGTGKKGTPAIVDGQLELNLDEPNAMMAILSSKPVGGSFIAEVGFDRDHAASLVLVRDKGGEPDPDNYTSICVTTGVDGIVSVQVHDRQNGQADVLDSRFASRRPATEPTTAPAAPLPPMDAAYRARFSTALTGQYSVPAKKTNGKLRIFRDFVSGMIRFYYEIRPEIMGEPCTGYLELQPSPEWDGYTGAYYVGPAVRTGDAPATVRFRDWRIFRTPRSDRDDRATGFKVTRRDYNFSGYSAEGLVVSFGRAFPFRDADRKLVFWSAANYVPFWHLDDQLGLMYESIETWSKDKTEGCFEPMSDRLLRFSRVAVTMDNTVRKRIQWSYTLLNPDYVPWGQKQGARQLPEVEEIWNVYPDGLVLREQRYYPAADGTAPLEWNQVAELDPIIGSKSRPADWLAEDTITITGIRGRQTKLKWPGKEGDFTDPVAREIAAVVTARFAPEQVPDAFLAYCNDPRFSGAAPLELISSWHRNQWWMFSHFPANYQPFESPTNSQATMPGQITHGGLICLGATRSPDWSSDFQMDPNGRKYRRWVTLLGLEKRGDTAASLRRVGSWLYGASVSDPRGCRYMGYDPQTLEYGIWVDPGRSDCSFVMKPTPRTQAVVRPLIRVEGWGERVPEVRVTGVPLRAGEEMEAAVEGAELVIWINREFTGPTKITLVGQ